MTTPFIYTTNQIPHTREIWLEKEEKTETRQCSGTHALFAARVPFIPGFLSNDFTRATSGDLGRIGLIVKRQIRFINDLLFTKYSNAIENYGETYDLRFIAYPRPEQPYCNIEIVFLGKAFHPNPEIAKNKAIGLWQKFFSHFPLEDPFNYPLLPITTEVLCQTKSLDPRKQFESNYLWPIPRRQYGSEILAEICKYGEVDPYREVDEYSEYLPFGYYPYPFRPVLDFSAMGRFLETLARQKEHCLVSISLQPTSLFPNEIKYITRALEKYEQVLESPEGRWKSQHRQKRFKNMWEAYDPLITQHKHLFSIKIQVIGETKAPLDLVEALGSEITNNSTAEPRQWSYFSPDGKDQIKIAAENFACLEHRIWHEPDLKLNVLSRLPYLVSAYEAVGAFRLPIPPESGYLPGLMVRDEPFVLPSELAPKYINTDEKKQKTQFVSLGQIIHRGNPTESDFTISVDDLKRHGLITGSTGSGKTNTCLHLLTQLWKKYEIPFLVIYPIDKPDYRLLKEDIKDDLLIFTLGDETTSPFRFNPFAVSPDILLKTHISQLMRCFMAAFSMWDPLPAIYRAALRQVFEDLPQWSDLNTAKGCRGKEAFPTVYDFYKTILDLAPRLTAEYGEEVRGNIRQASEIRLRDLLQNAGHILNVNADSSIFKEVLQRPTVMELGQIGSSEDTALVMGFLLTSLFAELTSLQKQPKPKDEKPFQHITLIEEAHRLMAANTQGSGEFLADPRSKGAEDFSNILAEVRGYGEGILIAEQIPTMLVTGAIGNTYLKIMHWLEDKDSFNLFCEIMNLNNQQRDYSRTLQAGQAIVRSRAGRPVLVRVKHYGEHFLDEQGQIKENIDVSDDAVRSFMQDKEKPIAIPDVIPFELNFQSIEDQEKLRYTEGETAWAEDCQFCKGKCKYASEVQSLIKIKGLETNEKFMGELYEALHGCDWAALKGFGSTYFPADLEEKHKMYSFSKYWVSLEIEEFPYLVQVLENFEENYHGE